MVIISITKEGLGLGLHFLSYSKMENRKPIKKWLCKECNKEHTKPYIRQINKKIVTGVGCCPHCKKPCVDLDTFESNHTQKYIGDDSKWKIINSHTQD